MTLGAHATARLLAIVAAAALVGLAMAFSAFAVYVTLAERLSAAEAAALTAGGSLALALLAVWASARAWRSRRQRLRAGPREPVEKALQQFAGPLVTELSRRHPEGALAASVLLGAGAGYSRTLRRLLSDLYVDGMDAGDRRSPRR